MKYFLILFLLAGAEAFGACNHNFSGSSITYTVGDTNPTISSSVTLTKTGNSGNCGNYFIGFNSGGASTYSRRVRNNSLNTNISYNLYKANNLSGVLKDNGDISSNSETLFGTILNNQPVTQDYYFALAPFSATSPPRFGTYTDSVTVKSYSGTWSNPDTQEDSFNLNITVTVPKLIYLSMISSGGTFDAAQT
jgi:spore coat protein U-like protein